MIRQRIWATILVAVLIAVSMATVKHIQKLNNGIELKQIQLKDNAVQLKLLDKKYDDLNKQLDRTGSDKAKVEQQLQELQKERDSLQKQLQAKVDAKNKAIARATLGAVGGTVSAQVAPSGTIEDIVRLAALKYGLEPSYLLRIAKCESRFNPNAVNKNYTAGGGHPSGLFQFIPSTWTRMSLQAGYAGSSVFDATANANVAAWAFSHGRASEWECK